MSKLHRVKITTVGETLKGATVEIDGIPVKGLLAVEFKSGVKEFNTCHLTFIAGETEIEIGVAEGVPEEADE